MKRDKLDFIEWQAQVLLFFREAPIELAAKTHAEINGIMGSREAQEKPKKVED